MITMDAIGAMGWIIVLGGICGIAIAFNRSKQDVRSMSRRNHRQPRPEPINTRPVKRSEELVEAKSGGTVTLLGESERAVLAMVILYEMFQRGGSTRWEKTGSVSRALVLAGNVLIFKVPSKEGGESTWLRAERIDTGSLFKFYLGTDDNPGPARRFKNNGQSSPVAYKLPKEVHWNLPWEVVDIGQFKTEVDGESPIFESGDNFPFVTSHQRDGELWLLYLDHRKGEARGTGGLFKCQPFEPSVEVTEML